MKESKRFLLFIFSALLFAFAMPMRAAAEGISEGQTILECIDVNNPATGDETKIMPVIIIAAAAFVCIIVVSIITKKKK
ncbi:MAG: hypothetical protein IJZ90_03725 [Clostridia bacterium]|nr:hypothetical protein [Clostridia bacterium]